MSFTQVYQAPRAPRPFHLLPSPGGLRAGHDPPSRRGLGVPHTLRSSKSSASDTVLARDPQSHTLATPRSPAHGDSPPDTPSAPPPAATHTRPRDPPALPPPPPAGPQHLRGPGMTVAILLPGSCPQQVPAGPVLPALGRALRPPIHSFPGGREHRGHSQSGRRGGPARAMLGVVVPRLGLAGPHREAGQRWGPRHA